MQHALVTYFVGEKRWSLVFVALGVAAQAAAFAVWRGAGPFRGAALPLAGVALIELAVGGTVFLRTDAQVAQLEDQLRREPGAFHAAETARMTGIMRSFTVIKTVEIALLGVAVALLLACRPPAFAAGVGLGLLLQAGVTLAADVVAEHRGRIYLEAVKGAPTTPVP